MLAVMTDAIPPGMSGSERAGMPRWVKASLLGIAALVSVLVIAKVAGIGGDHSPQRHGGTDEAPAADIEDGGHRSPVDHTP